MYRLLFLLFTFLPVAALAESRAALVIGNDGYSGVTPLQKAVTDASAMAGRLREVGFTTTLVTNAGRREMNLAVAEFTARLQPGDTAAVFFAGHGVEIDGENYLLPVDITAPTGVGPSYIQGESIALSRLLDRVRATGARTTLAFIAQSGAALGRADLGSEKALAVLKAARAPGCAPAPKPVVAAPSAAAPSDPSPEAPQVTSPSIVGRWAYSAECPLFVRSAGTITYRSTGGTGISGTWQDSFGQTGTNRGTQSGRTFITKGRFAVAPFTETGTLSADGQSYSSTSTMGCKVRANRM